MILLLLFLFTLLVLVIETFSFADDDDLGDGGGGLVAAEEDANADEATPAIADDAHWLVLAQNVDVSPALVCRRAVL